VSAVAVQRRAGHEVGNTFVTVEHDCNSEQDKIVLIHKRRHAYMTAQMEKHEMTIGRMR
jgi:hypothetical protein